MKNSGLCYSGPSTPENVASKRKMNPCQKNAGPLDQIPTQENKTTLSLSLSYLAIKWVASKITFCPIERGC